MWGCKESMSDRPYCGSTGFGRVRKRCCDHWGKMFVGNYVLSNKITEVSHFICLCIICIWWELLQLAENIHCFQRWQLSKDFSLHFSFRNSIWEKQIQVWAFFLIFFAWALICWVTITKKLKLYKSASWGCVVHAVGIKMGIALCLFSTALGLDVCAAKCMTLQLLNSQADDPRVTPGRSYRSFSPPPLSRRGLVQTC